MALVCEHERSDMSIGLAVLMVLPTPLCLHAKRKGVASAQRSGLSSERKTGGLVICRSAHSGECTVAVGVSSSVRKVEL